MSGERAAAAGRRATASTGSTGRRPRRLGLGLGLGLGPGLALALLLSAPATLVAQDGDGTNPAGVAASEDTPVLAGPDVVVEAPQEPILLGETFEIVVRGRGLTDEVSVGAAAHAEDVFTGRVERRAEDDQVELRIPLRIARQGVFDLVLFAGTDDGQRLQLPPLELEVLLDLPADRQPRVADLLEPVEVPLPATSPWPFLLLCCAGLVALGAYVVLAGRIVKVVIPPPPADLVAIEALARLRLRLPNSAEELLPFTVELSDVLRDYVMGCFELAAPARTTEEFLAEVTRRHDGLAEQQDLLAGFLMRCDLVKFARHRPALAEATVLLDTVERFVEETRGGVRRGSSDDGPGSNGSAPVDGRVRAPAELVA